MVTYYELGANKRLCDIVIAGSHDAGITKGKSNVQTQIDNLFQQALNGIRVFDLRIAATMKPGAPIQLKSFHADPILMSNSTSKGTVWGGANTDKRKLTTTTLMGGAFGEKLVDLLVQAKNFVTFVQGSEFLILKFDKCTNWAAIAEVCVKQLGEEVIFTGTGSLNEKTLEQLKNKVVVLFSEKGRLEARQAGYGVEQGILGWMNITDEAMFYSKLYDGLQYIGKGGTNPLDGKSDGGKMEANIKKQGGLMSKGADAFVDPEVMGMMYWTTTGLNRSIQERDMKMWADSSPLTKLWTQGLKDAIESRLLPHMNMTNYSTGPDLKAFMPNIIMIDFADHHKGKFVRDLNTTASTMLTKAAIDEKALLDLSANYTNTRRKYQLNNNNNNNNNNRNNNNNNSRNNTNNNG